MQQQPLSIICFVIVVVLAACAGGKEDLSRVDALDAIKKHAEESRWTEEIKLDAEASSRDPNFNFLAEIHNPHGHSSYMMGLDSIGANVTLRHRSKQRGTVYEVWGYDLKESAKPFVIREKGGPGSDGYTLRSVEAIIGQRSPKEIVQMTAPAPRMDGVTVSRVTFRWSWQLNNDFYYAYSWGNPHRKVQGGPHEGQAVFVLYDHGWVLDEIDF